MINLRSRLRNAVQPWLRQYPGVRRTLSELDIRIERARHAAAAAVPGVIRPDVRNLEIAVTARCNLRCVGCRYGRDFMPGHELPLGIVKQLLDDAKALGFWDVRFYGGEPLLHPDLPNMVEHAIGVGLGAYVTTNATLLGSRIDDLYRAGLRTINIGFYGTGHVYDAYVQRRERFGRLEDSVRIVRERYGSEFRLRINWLLMRPSCSIEALHQAFDFARRYDTKFQVDLIHYSLPYFTEGPDRALQFRPADRPAIESVVREILILREQYPQHFHQSAEGLRSIPDWLIAGPDMRVPCDSYQMIWVGPDGTVQQCYVTYHLGNLHEKRLTELLNTPTHACYARQSYALECPNCHCHYEIRVRKHAASLRHYGHEQPWQREAGPASPLAPAPRSLPIVHT